MSVTTPGSSGQDQQDFLDHVFGDGGPGNSGNDDSDDDDPVLRHQRDEALFADDPLSQRTEEP
jgi:hypothetical protein